MLFFYSICSPHSHLASLKKIAQKNINSLITNQLEQTHLFWFLDTIKNSHILGIYVRIDRT